jgi:hypothetical protein
VGKFYEGVYEELKLYVRQSAWLNAIPEKRGVNAGEPKSRLQTLQDTGVPAELPEVDLGYLVAYLWDVGPTLSSSGGESPLTRTELRAWQEDMGLELQPWESRILMRLSHDYLIQIQKARKPDCQAPYMKRQTMRAHVAAKVDELFG